MKAGDAALLDANLANWSTVEIVEVGELKCVVKLLKSEILEVDKNRLTIVMPSEVTDLYPDIKTNDYRNSW